MLMKGETTEIQMNNFEDVILSNFTADYIINYTLSDKYNLKIFQPKIFLIKLLMLL